MSKVLIIDFGGQYNLLIARRVRECGVYCELKSYKTSIDDIMKFGPDAIILSGGFGTVFDKAPPKADSRIFTLGIPILGICYGLQYMMQELGGVCKSAEHREYGKTEFEHNGKSPLFDKIVTKSISWASHGVEVEKIAKGFEIIAHSKSCKVEAVADDKRRFYGVQFHPEVKHTEFGQQIISNFLFGISHLSNDWKIKDIAEKYIEYYKRKIGRDNVLLALSGGVDSSVVAALLKRAVGSQLTCIFVNHGLLRFNEAETVMDVLSSNMGVNIRLVDASDEFLSALSGVTEPERKRKIIGEKFISVFEREAKKIGHVKYFAQGTIYPDIVESGKGGESMTIKSHHNVGGLPEHIDFDEIIEPLKYLFKDEVRKLGCELGLPDSLVNRQPFPGPGLAIRIIGEITKEKIRIVQESDFILRSILKKECDKLPSQYFTALTPMRSVGVMGDERTYDYALAIRAVDTDDFMTANFTRIPWDILEKISNAIVAEVKGVNRVMYDVTSKPPATVEFE